MMAARLPNAGADCKRHRTNNSDRHSGDILSCRLACRLLAVLAVTDPVKEEAAGVVAAIEVGYVALASARAQLPWCA